MLAQATGMTLVKAHQCWGGLVIRATADSEQRDS
jgi:hypothetical protein